MSNIRASFLLLFPVITARKRSLGQGNIFAPVCHSVHGGGVIPACIAGGIPACFAAGLLGEGGGIPACLATGLQGGSPGPQPGGKLRGLAGGCIPACTEAAPPPTWTATASGGTHPTGMHSC